MLSDVLPPTIFATHWRKSTVLLPFPFLWPLVTEVYGPWVHEETKSLQRQGGRKPGGCTNSHVWTHYVMPALGGTYWLGLFCRHSESSHWPHQHIKALKRFDSLKKQSGSFCITMSVPPDLPFHCRSLMSSNTAAEIKLVMCSSSPIKHHPHCEGDWRHTPDYYFKKNISFHKL